MFRAFPGVSVEQAKARERNLHTLLTHLKLNSQNWEAYLERPDGSVELLKTYRTKPPLNEVATLVRETSFQRYAINNDRYAKGFGGRL